MNAPTAGLAADDRYVLLVITRLCAQANGRPVSRSAIAADMHQAGIPAARRTRQALQASIANLAESGHVERVGERVAPMGGVKPVAHQVHESVTLHGHRCVVCDACHCMIERWPLGDEDKEFMFGDKRWAVRVKRFRKQHPEPRP